MRQKNILVLCRHSGVLLKYSALLNEVGCFQVRLCSNMTEVSNVLNKTKKIDCFVLDDFRVIDKNKNYIRRINRYCVIRSYLLLGDFSYEDQFRVFAWAKKYYIPLLGMVKHPVSSLDFKRYIEVL